MTSSQPTTPPVTIRSSIRIDCHFHISATTPGHGSMSDSLLRSLPFRFMRWRLEIPGNGEVLERGVEAKLAQTIAETDASSKP